MTIERIDYSEYLNDLLICQFSGRELIQGRIDTFAEQCQFIEDLLLEMFEQKFITGAKGVQLDSIGALYQLTRDGDSDQVFRERILNRVALSSRSGTRPDIISLTKAAMGEDVEVNIFEYTKFAFVQVNKEITSIKTKGILDGLTAGVGGVVAFKKESRRGFTLTSNLQSGSQNVLTDELNQEITDENGQLITDTNETPVENDQGKLCSHLDDESEDCDMMYAISSGRVVTVNFGFLIDENGDYILQNDGGRIRIFEFSS